MKLVLEIDRVNLRNLEESRKPRSQLQGRDPQAKGRPGPEDDEDLCRLEEWGGPAQGQQRSADEAENLRINGDGGNGREVLVPAPGVGRCCK